MDVLINILEGFQLRLLIYFSIGGFLSFLIYFIFKNKNNRYKIQSLLHSWKDVRREVKYSISSLLIFSILAFALSWLTRNGYTQVYKEVEEYGNTYWYLSIFLAIVIHDAHFYWTHRLLHTRWLMRKVHQTHHLSHDPTLWAAFAFHPIEAIINFSIFYVLAFAIPLHQYIFFYFFFFNSANNIIAHCGFEIFPKNFTTHWLGKWITTSTHHNMHHKLGKGNYGLYFTWLDYVFNTNHPDYHQQYDQIIANRKNIENQVH